MTKQIETNQPKNVTFGKWLKGFITFKISNNSRELKLFPRWIVLGVIALSYAGKFIGQEDNFYVFLEFVIVFLFGGVIWYGLNRLMGKTKI